ncbi:MAG: hypothetical protein DMF21_10315 [Verrucomicrobia bacterium]|nr:MAG: hypothetical protein DMF21_10315 [Verrucomicrobiota bacterium]
MHHPDAGRHDNPGAFHFSARHDSLVYRVISVVTKRYRFYSGNRSASVLTSARRAAKRVVDEDCWRTFRASQQDLRTKLEDGLMRVLPLSPATALRIR